MKLQKSQVDDYDKINEHPTIMSPPGSHKCPVNSFKLYFSELNPDVNDLFQLPNPNYTLPHHQLYKKTPTGINTIGSFIKEISKAASLSYI